MKCNDKRAFSCTPPEATGLSSEEHVLGLQREERFDLSRGSRSARRGLMSAPAPMFAALAAKPDRATFGGPGVWLRGSCDTVFW